MPSKQWPVIAQISTYKTALMKPLFFLGLIGSLSSCALVTVPLKLAGSAAGAAIDVTGKAVGAGVSRLGRKEKDSEEEEE